MLYVTHKLNPVIFVGFVSLGFFWCIMKTLDLSKVILSDAVVYQSKITIQKAKELISIPLDVLGKSTQNRQGEYIAAVLENETGKKVIALSHKMEGKVCKGKLRQVSAANDGAIVWIADLESNGRKFGVSVKDNAGKKVFDLLSAKGKVILVNDLPTMEKKAQYQEAKGRILNSL
jgi:hypothetical protein